MSADETLREETTEETATMPEQAADAAADASSSADALQTAAASLQPIVEALIFASPEPLSMKALFKLLDTEPREHVEAAVAALREMYARPGGLQLVEVAGGFQIVTRPELHEWVRRLFHERTTQKLSVQALETLAVIAYRQPITAPEITEVRGVNTSGVLTTLIERKLVKIVGRKQVVGRPFMYATTKEFLERFGLRDLNDLPKVEDMAELLGFDALQGLDQDGATATLPFDAQGDDATDVSAESADTERDAASPEEPVPTDEDAVSIDDSDDDPSAPVH